MPTFAQLQSDLRNLSQEYVHGKGGIRLIQTPKGAILQNLNKEGKPIRFRKVQIAWLVQTFPELTDVLSRNMETIRRVQGLRSRLATFLGESFRPDAKASPQTFDGAINTSRALTAEEKAFVEKLPPRNYQYLEALDGRPIPQTLAELSALNVRETENLPRAFTVVDMTDPRKPVRLIFQIEFDTGGLRTDEAFIRYIASPNEIAELRDGRKFAELKGMMVSELRVFYSDLSKHLTGKKLLDHHIKLLDTLNSVAKKFIRDYEAKLSGTVVFACKEVHVHSTHVEVTGNTAALARATEAAGAPGSGMEAIDKVTTASVRMEPEMAGELIKDFHPRYEARGMKGLHDLSLGQVDAFVTKLSKIGEELLDLARKAK